MSPPRANPTGNSSRHVRISLWWWVAALALLSTPAQAQLTNDGLFDQALAQVVAQTSYWQTAAREAAGRLFLYLGTISLVWTFGFMALRRADVGEYLSELVRFLIVLGFFWWLLDNGPAIGQSIIASMRELGARSISGAPGAPEAPGKFSPSSIVDIGFEVLRRALDSASITDPVAAGTGIALALFILAMTALTAFNMLLLLVSGYFLLYGGVFFLGFGGSRWTSEMALNWYRTVLGLGASLFGMALVVGVFSTMLINSHARLSEQFSIAELAVLALIAMLMLLMTRAVPTLFSGLISGASIGQVGSMGVGAGAALTAGAAAAAVASMGIGAAASGAANAAGLGRALSAAMGAAGSSASDASAAGAADRGAPSPSEGGPPRGAPPTSGGALSDAMGPPEPAQSATPAPSQAPPAGMASQLFSALGREMSSRWDDRVSRTFGGRLAQRLAERDARADSAAPPQAPADDTPTNTISPSSQVPPEVADYVQRLDTSP